MDFFPLTGFPIPLLPFPILSHLISRGGFTVLSRVHVTENTQGRNSITHVEKSCEEHLVHNSLQHVYRFGQTD